MKKLMIALISLIILFTIIYALISLEIIKLPTVGEDEETPEAFVTADDLQDECYYVWHDSENSLEQDLEGYSSMEVFNLCPMGNNNWKKNKNIDHTLWFSSEEDESIPTLYPGDELIYVSSTSVPFEGIHWERYADYGYTIGVANMVEDKSGHHRIVFDVDNGYEGFINPLSDATEVSEYFSNTDVFLDKVGSVNLQDGLVSDGGTVMGLNQDEIYKCIWYKGSKKNEFELCANQHTFCVLEEFDTYDYEFVESYGSNPELLRSCITISIPEWFKTGYYYVAGTGFFRYVNVNDLETYNGEAYDPGIDWNDPIILYSETGMQIYNPSTGLDDRKLTEEKEEGSAVLVNENQKNTQEGQAEESTGMLPQGQFYERELDPEKHPSDPGAEYYEEDFGDEILVQ